MISLDGFRWDYLDRGLSPNLTRLAKEGVRAQGLVPVFLTKTFPNHYSIVTGRYPAEHGIVGNQFTAPELGKKFIMWERETTGDSRFWKAEPIWVTAEKQGQHTAPILWPGSEVKIGGVQPAYALPFNSKVPDTARVARILELLDLPPQERPTFLTLYFSPVDAAGHEFGPDSKEVNQAIAKVDSTMGRLMAGLAERGLGEVVNLVIVSDHGMATIAPDRVIRLDDYIDRSSIAVDELSPTLTAWPGPGLEDSVYNGLVRAPHLTTFRRGQLPPRFHLDGSPRTPPIVAIADEGWTIAWRDTTATSDRWSEFGNHGYDNSLPIMRAIFIAHGPGFRRGLRVPAFSNIHVYPLMAELLGLDPAVNDGSLDSVRTMLVHCDSRHCAPP